MIATSSVRPQNALAEMKSKAVAAQAEARSVFHEKNLLEDKLKEMREKSQQV